MPLTAEHQEAPQIPEEVVGLPVGHPGHNQTLGALIDLLADARDARREIAEEDKRLAPCTANSNKRSSANCICKA